MNCELLVKQLSAHPELNLSLRLPDGACLPAHFHITEVGHVTKRFVDCGGVRRVQESCLLQTWVHEDVDHRLTAGKLADVFERVGDVLEDLSLPVEFEVELGTVAQFGLLGVSVVAGNLELALTAKHTDCLARGVCLPGSCDAKPESDCESDCEPVAAPTCSPGGGCC
jgi:hypothetical protein